MKFKLLSIIIISLIGITVNAQQFHGGIMAGVVGSQVAGDNFSGYHKGGLFFGGFVSLNASPKSSFRMELEYFQKGSRENPTEKNGYTSYLLRLNYIELPVFYQYTAGKFTIFGGPSAGFIMSYYEEDTYLNVISDEPGYIKPARATLQINFGFRYDIVDNFGVDLRTNNSLMNVFSENTTGDVWRFWDYGRFNDAIVLSMYYRFK